MNLKPLKDRVIIRRKKVKDTTPGGIIIPESAREVPIWGEVVAVGTGKLLESGLVREPLVAVGQEVVFSRYEGQEVDIDGETYVAVYEDTLLGVVER